MLCSLQDKIAVGTVPLEFCSMSKLSALSLWTSANSTGNSAITCTRPCLSARGIGWMPPALPQCPTSTEIGLCGLIAATNIATVYPQWQCRSNGTTITSPCSTNWPGVQCNVNTTAGYVVNITLPALHSTGMIQLHGTKLILLLRRPICRQHSK